MDANKIINHVFDSFDESDLALILQQVGKRFLILRSAYPDSAFWFSIIQRVIKVLSSSPQLNDEEKNLILNPPENGNGNIKAIRSLRDRTGLRLRACKDIIDAWIEKTKELAA